MGLAYDRVIFHWRDSKDGKRLKVMTLEAAEFIRRLLLHVSPPRFVKIRHFGFFANRNRSQALVLCRQHLQAALSDHPTPEMLTHQQQQAMERRCPVCRRGTLHLVGWVSVAELTLLLRSRGLWILHEHDRGNK